MSTNSSNTKDKASDSGSSYAKPKKIDYETHWDNVYLNKSEEKLGWYETNLSPTMDLLSKTDLKKTATILNVGAGSTTLIDELLHKGYSNIIATDLSKIALQKLEERVGKGKVDCIVDDLTKPENLKNIPPVDLWIDRAVLHFFTNEEEQDNYFDLLKSKVRSNGYVLMAEFNLNGATKCAGLDIHRYNKEMLAEKLGENFDLIESFDYTYNNPSGGERPYVYTLFRKK
jgi:SAM-dependent methyltransferase